METFSFMIGPEWVETQRDEGKKHEAQANFSYLSIVQGHDSSPWLAYLIYKTELM